MENFKELIDAYSPARLSVVLDRLQRLRSGRSPKTKAQNAHAPTVSMRRGRKDDSLSSIIRKSCL
jgi:hypothetical protein